MPYYRRAIVPGGTFFLTIVTFRRAPIFNDALARGHLRSAIEEANQNRPFTLQQMVLLPDHLHLILTLPEDDTDYSVRVASIKATFTSRFLDTHGPELPQQTSRQRQRYRGVWQKRFWEHWVRSDDDLAGCEEYIWFNPVKHGLCRCPHQWPWSTFHREVDCGRMPVDWQCICGCPRSAEPPDMAGAEMD